MKSVLDSQRMQILCLEIHMRPICWNLATVSTRRIVLTRGTVMCSLTKNSLCITSVNTLSWWRHQMETFPLYCPFVRGIHRSPVNSPHKGQWRGALMFSLICLWINGWVNNGEAGDLRRYRAHYDVTVVNCVRTNMQCVLGWLFRRNLKHMYMYIYIYSSINMYI